MGRSDYLKLGSWNARCSMCGFKFKADELSKNWQGMYRCSAHQEIRQPQDFVRGVPDVQTPPWVQPIDQNVFVALCAINDQCAIPGYAIPGCFTPNNVVPGNTIF